MATTVSLDYLKGMRDHLLSEKTAIECCKNACEYGSPEEVFQEAKLRKNQIETDLLERIIENHTER